MINKLVQMIPIIHKNDLRHILSGQKKGKERCYQQRILEEKLQGRCKQFCNYGKKLLIIIGFDKVVAAAYGKCFFLISTFGHGGCENERNKPGTFVLEQYFKNLVPINTYHNNITDDEIWAANPGDINPIMAIIGYQYLIAFQFKKLCCVFPDLLIILDTQDCFRHWM